MSFGKKSHDGIWTKAISLDRQIAKSIPIGENKYGHMQFDNTRTEIGQRMYELKYRGNKESAVPISQAMKTCICEDFAIDFSGDVGVIPMPPTNSNRPYQPVYEIARRIKDDLNLKWSTKILSKTETPHIKNIENLEEKKKALKGAFSVVDITGQWDIIIVDDFFGSGATLHAATETLLACPNVRNVYAILATRKNEDGIFIRVDQNQDSQRSSERASG